jgi:27-O-demethylrifamycin SV methyltransferase
MHHMPDRWHVLRQVARVLRPGGRLAIGDFLLVPGPDGQDGDAQRLFEASKGVLTIVGLDEYLSNIRAAGLVPEAVEDVSKHTRPSWAKAAVRFEALRDQVEPHIGAEQCDLILYRYHLFSEEPTLGYVLLTAVKPA